MYSLLSLFALLGTLSSAAVVPRAGGQDVPSGQCCFTLHDASTGKTVQQDSSTGYLYLSGGKPSGWYCIDLSDSRDVLWDDFNNACFVSPDHQFKCLDPILGPNKWALKKTSNGDGGKIRLTKDGQTAFKACSSSKGGEVLYSKDKGGCRSIQLAAQTMKGTCKGLK